jgi:hypothetical protein
MRRRGRPRTSTPSDHLVLLLLKSSIARIDDSIQKNPIKSSATAPADARYRRQEIDPIGDLAAG